MLPPELMRSRPHSNNAPLLLCDMRTKPKENLSEQDPGVCPSLLINDDPRVKSIAWGFISGERPLRQTFDEYHRKWLKNCDFNFTEDFLRESQGVFRMVAERIDRENRVLFPKLVEIGLFQETRA